MQHKSRKRKGFTLIELLIVVVIVGILALAAIPLITSNTRDARRSEGEQMMGSMKGQARVAFAKIGEAPTQLTGAMDSTTKGCNVDAAELDGQYYSIANAVGSPSATEGLVTANPNTASDGVGTHTFEWGGGAGSFTWP